MTVDVAVAPGPKAGRGLKPGWLSFAVDAFDVAPGPKAGRGLKHLIRHNAVVAVLGSARPQSRARIETTLNGIGV